MNRFRCWLFGHKLREEYGGVECARCGAYRRTWEEEEWTDREAYGVFWRLVVAWINRPRFTWPRCQHCGKRMLRRYKDERDFCSRECHDAWLPF